MRHAVAALALLAAATTARADQSSRWGSFELGLGSYRPDIDSEFPASPGPYEQVFGGGRGWMFTAGLAKTLRTSAFGSLEVGLQSGYFQESGRGQFLDGGGDSGDETKLRIVPITLGLAYRIELLVERYRIPFAPYGRVAFERYQWWVTDASGDSGESGATNGWSATAGLALLLDFFDPGLARELDRDSGVNHTYLYFEAKRSFIDDFGSSSSWDLSDESFTLTGGLLLAF